MSQKIIIADNFPVFRAGLARFLAVEEDFSIVGQCDDLFRLYKAIEVSTGALVIVASSMEPSLPEMIRRAEANQVRLVVILEKGDQPEFYVRLKVHGVLYRDVSRLEMIKCLRLVSRGASYVQRPAKDASAQRDADSIGERVRSRLSKKELQIVGLIVQGYKNKEIALELNNSEQVIKNYLRSIFDKTGVSDRLELALFSLHHHLLLKSFAGVSEGMSHTEAAA
jgi:DNA-binding NarL/FixJ family response regulator